MRIPSRGVIVVGGLAALVIAWATLTQLPAIGAGAVLLPARRAVTVPLPDRCKDEQFTGVDVVLRGWRCEAIGRRRGTLIYLHGIADNRQSSAGIVSRFTHKGFDVVAYDSRAHGSSDGQFCTYGFFEKVDLQRVLDSVSPGPIVAVGSSLGGAVALQAAAIDSRITAIVAADTFADLKTVATERAPFPFTATTIERALRLAEQQASFRVADVSPVLSAAKIAIPVFLLHGDADADTSPHHSRRIHAALRSSKRLTIVPGARHGESMGGMWSEIERWIENVVANTVSANGALAP